MFTFRSSGLWSNSVWFHLLLSSLLWLPVAAFSVWVIIDVNDLESVLILLAITTMLALTLLKRAQTKIRFPTVEVSPHHLILNVPMYKRRVYNLSDIEAPRFILNTLYFRHHGWPILASLDTMPKEVQVELLKLLSKN